MLESSKRFTVFAIGLALASALAFAVSVGESSTSQVPVDTILGVATLAILAIVAEQLAVLFLDRVSLTASNLPILLAMMFLGPIPSMVVAAFAGLWGFWRERNLAIVLFNVSNFVIATFLGSTVFAVLMDSLGFTTTEVTPALLISGAAAGVVYEFTNLGLASVGSRLEYGRSIVRWWRQEILPFLQSLAILVGVGLMVAALYAKAGLVAVTLLFIPLFAAQYMFKLLVTQKHLLEEQKQLSDEYLEMNIGLAAAMVVLLDSKDEYTASHSAAVAMYCRDMAKALGMTEGDSEALHLAGLLHDLGKVGTPDAILRKDGKLDSDEWLFIRQHPSKGAEVLSHLAAYKDVADIVRYHHERLDGSGYPYGIRDGQIPEMSKVLAVADTYHAMTSDRPYRAARSSFDALKELRRMAGISLDGKYVELLASILRDKDLAYREGTATDFMGEYERGRINLRLRGDAPSEFNQSARAARDPAAG